MSEIIEHRRSFVNLQEGGKTNFAGVSHGTS
jgi:hypothetical protein